MSQKRVSKSKKPYKAKSTKPKTIKKPTKISLEKRLVMFSDLDGGLDEILELAYGYETSRNTALLLEHLKEAMFICDKLAKDSKLHGFDNAYDMFRDARLRLQEAYNNLDDYGASYTYVKNKVIDTSDGLRKDFVNWDGVNLP